MRSSCQSVPCAGDAMNLLKPALSTVFGMEIWANSGTALGSIGTKVWPEPLVKPEGQSVGEMVQRSVKSPTAPGAVKACAQPLFVVAPGQPRSAAEGTTTLKSTPGTTSFRHSSDQKKKVLVLALL